MSTKVFNGHEIVGHRLEVVLAVLKRFRQELQPLARAKVARVVLNYAVAAHDAEALGFAPSLAKPYLMGAHMKVLDRIQELEQTKRRDPAVDMGFEVMLFPVEGRLLALVYCEQREFLERWNRQPWRRDFGYWDNTDAPGDVDETCWAERGRLWALALGEEYQPPAELGLSFTVQAAAAGWELFDDAELAPHLPSLELRARMALTPAVLAHLKSQGAPSPATPRELSELLRSSLAQEVLADLLVRLPQSLTVPQLR